MQLPDTRRNFLHTAAIAAAGVTAAVKLAGQTPSGIQVPKMKFGKAEIGRLIAGCNTFYGFAHFNQTLQGDEASTTPRSASARSCTSATNSESTPSTTVRARAVRKTWSGFWPKAARCI